MSADILGSQVWINGEIVPAAHATVPLGDRGFTLGDGVFETMLWTGDRVRFFDFHMARLAQACAALGFDLPCRLEQIAEGLRVLGADAAGSTAALRLTLTRGCGARGLAIPDQAKPLLIASIAPLNPAASEPHVTTVAIIRNAGAPSTRFKTLSYIDNIMALQEARAAGADDAIMLGTTGYVACTSSANLVIRHAGQTLTPSVVDGALPGIVRGLLLQVGLVTEARISLAMLAGCDAAAVTNALIGVRRVATIDGRRLMDAPEWIRSMSDMLNQAANT